MPAAFVFDFQQVFAGIQPERLMVKVAFCIKDDAPVEHDAHVRLTDFALNVIQPRCGCGYAQFANPVGGELLRRDVVEIAPTVIHGDLAYMCAGNDLFALRLGCIEVEVIGGITRCRYLSARAQVVAPIVLR